MTPETRKQLLGMMRHHFPVVAKDLTQNFRNWYTLKVKKAISSPPYSAVLYV